MWLDGCLVDSVICIAWHCKMRQGCDLMPSISTQHINEAICKQKCASISIAQTSVAVCALLTCVIAHRVCSVRTHLDGRPGPGPHLSLPVCSICVPRVGGLLPLSPLHSALVLFQKLFSIRFISSHFFCLASPALCCRTHAVSGLNMNPDIPRL